ncbi:MAG: arginine--tRNA ligase [Candidatus Komeilibacteria bacterium]|nr:arginine--tRNA ligase [Candidatus Komeilibacteria bacterium]
MTIRIKALLEDELQQALGRLKWGQFIEQIAVTKPDPKYGDYATNLPLRLTKELKLAPEVIAEKLHQTLLESVQFTQAVTLVQFAGGFLNFHLRPEFLEQQALAAIAGTDFGFLNLGKGKKANVEFISANPTGPLTLHNIRGGVVGDVLANVLERTGWAVTREYLVNDAGHQIEILGSSALASVGLIADDPEYYHGDYVKNWATDNLDFLQSRVKQSYEVGQSLAAYLLEYEIKPVISNGLGIIYDVYFSEWQELHQTGVIAKLFAELQKTKVAYEKDGAWWLKTTQHGDDQDRVIKKSDGQFTYFLSDLAYQLNKLARGATKTINVFGADHHGHTVKFNAALELMGQSPAEFILTQMMTVLEDGKEVRMSKRAGRFVTMKDLLDQVPADVIRFFTLRYSVNTVMHFNLQEALDTSEKNPIYYVQYAYARLKHILAQDQVRAALLNKKIDHVSLEDSSLALLKQILEWPDVLVEISESYQVNQLATYALAVADAFHRFYDQLRVIEHEVVRPERLAVVVLAEKVFAQILDTMGISAPDQM